MKKTQNMTEKVKPTFPCQLCQKAIKNVTIYNGLCYDCKLKIYYQTPEEKKRFLTIALEKMPLFKLPKEFLEVYFNDDEVFDEFLYDGPRDEFSSIVSTLAEAFTDELYLNSKHRRLEEDAKYISNSLVSAWNQWKKV